MALGFAMSFNRIHPLVFTTYTHSFGIFILFRRYLQWVSIDCNVQNADNYWDNICGRTGDCFRPRSASSKGGSSCKTSCPLQTNERGHWRKINARCWTSTRYRAYTSKQWSLIFSKMGSDLKQEVAFMMYSTRCPNKAINISNLSTETLSDWKPAQYKIIAHTHRWLVYGASQN